MSLREMFFGKKVKLPGVENTATTKPIIPNSEEGQEAMAAEKGIHPYGEEADWDEKIDAAKGFAEGSEPKKVPETGE